MTSKYTPAIYRLPAIDVEDIYKDSDVLIGSTINQPLFSLGFHSFIHRTKSALEITTKLETKNKFYYVVNQFEATISDYNEDISHLVKSYLDIKDEVIISRSFYKMWEMLQMFNLTDKVDMTLVGIAEAPGSFIQAFIKYREKFHTITKDKIHAQSINSFDFNLDYYIKKYPKLISIYKTSNKEDSNGDITNINTINNFKTEISKQADLIIADGMISRSTINNYIEQESYQLIFGEILTALKIQAKDGHFVLKIFDTFTATTIKLLYLLASFYEDTYIYKPYFSRSTSSEKYIVCRKFKYDSKKDKEFLDKRLKYLEKVFVQLKTTKFIMDIFPKFILTIPNMNVFKYVNILIANEMQISINQLVHYIKSNNYFGDEYHSFRSKQIDATKWWNSTYFTDKKVDFSKLLKDTTFYNDSELKLFVNKLN
jgi:23S rRNA U2552 (ribose-2'-O)-methylase RlmE/FtsJ